MITAFIQSKNLEVQRRQLQISAAGSFNNRKIDSIVLIRDALQMLSDGDESPQEIYTRIRPYWIYLNPETEKKVADAVRSRINFSDTDSRPSSKIDEAMLQLKNELFQLKEA